MVEKYEKVKLSRSIIVHKVGFYSQIGVITPVLQNSVICMITTAIGYLEDDTMTLFSPSLTSSSI